MYIFIYTYIYIYIYSAAHLFFHSAYGVVQSVMLARSRSHAASIVRRHLTAHERPRLCAPMASAGIIHLCSHAKKSTARLAVADPTTQQSPQVEHSRSLSRHLASRVSPVKARLARQFNLSSGVRPIARICQKSVKRISSCRSIVSRTLGQAKKRSRRHERVKDVKRRIRCGSFNLARQALGKRPPSTWPSGASESGPTPTKQRRRRLDEESDLVGPITESREAHLKRGEYT